MAPDATDRGPFRVLVLCTGNSARSRIGEALLATRGTMRAAARQAFGATYDALAARVDALLALPLEALGPDDLRERAQTIHAAAS